MTTIDITNIIGLSYPYDIYVCDVYGNNCILLSTVFTNIPPSNTILLPPQFDTASSVGIKVITLDGCERFKIIECDVLISPSPTPTFTPTPTPVYCYSFTSPSPTYYFTDSDVNIDKVYLYGNFTGYTNGYVTDYAGKIIRLNSDLTNDTTFSTGTGFNTVLYDGESIIEQSDGKIIATGSFTSYNGTSANRIIRLNSDGSIDASFVYGSGFNSFTQGGAIDSNGSIVITGYFSSYSGTSSPRIVRLLSNGQVDPSFVYGSGFNNVTIDVLINPDNGMYIVGYFSTYKGVSVSNGITKLLSNGSVDSTFSGGTGFSPFLPTNPNNIVRISGETSFYVAGYSTSYNGTLINRIVKLNEFGGIDTSFTGGTGFNNIVYTTDIIWVDKLFLTGEFTNYNGNSCLAKCIILNSDGSVLQSFNDSNYTNFFVNNYTVFAKSTSSGCIVPVYNYIVPTPTPTPTNTPTPTQTITQTPTPTITITPTLTNTPTITSTPTLTPTSTPLPSFMSTWDTTNTSPGSSASNQIHLPLELTGTYNFTVDWGDGNTDLITVWNQTETTHTYAIPGVYNLSIIGTIQGFNFYYGQDELKLLSISTFETLQLGNSGRYFFGCTNLDLSSVTDVLDLTGTISCNAMFYQCTSLTTIGNVSSWDVSNINDMSYMFGESTFNDNINSWDVSSVIYLNNMFDTNTVFNQSLNSWNVSGVTDMSSMFFYSTSFNGNITSWNTSNVTTMGGMFNNATNFNQNISSWNTSSVIYMGNMFAVASSFNQPIGVWDVSSVTDMTVMFYQAISFNQPLNGWAGTTSSVTAMDYMFNGAILFNQPLNLWNTVSVTSMGNMFDGAIAFNGNISTWNTSLVYWMKDMFRGATVFNQNISSWDTSSVTSMSGMFENAIAFNQNISGWTVSSVIYFNRMFYNATVFNAPIGSWTPTVADTFTRMFQNATSFNQPLNGWGASTNGVITMDYMFASATSFNQSLNSWDTSTVTTMAGMFVSAISFNGNISSWDTSSVTNMSGMFASSTAFNQNISGWNVSNVQNFNATFSLATTFNQPIGIWNVSGATNMAFMFASTTSFDQNIGSWNISNVGIAGFNGFMQSKTQFNYSATNLDAIYNGWSLLSVQTNIGTVDFNTIKYTLAGQSGKNILTGAPNNWVITDGGI